MKCKDCKHDFNENWIPVTERLPTDYQRLIVFTKSGDLYLSRFTNNKFIDIEYNRLNKYQENIISDVVEWRPLPTHRAD